MQDTTDQQDTACENCGDRDGIAFPLNGPGHTVYFCPDCAPAWFDGVS